MMKIGIAAQLINGEFVPINAKGYDEIEVEVNDINCLSIANKQLRLIGLGKNLYKITLKSFKALKKELNRKGLAYRFDNLKR